MKPPTAEIAPEIALEIALGTFAWSEFEALGTYAYLATSASIEEATAVARRVVGDVDRTCSRFRDDSDLSRANRNAGSWTRVDPLLVAAVRVALTAAEESGGLVDPCLGIGLAELGYDADFALIRSQNGTRRLRTRHPVGRWRQLEIDPDGALKVPAGVHLDLGATAKAWASDLVAASVLEATGAAVVVSLGGDLRIATPQGTDFAGWPVSITESPRTGPAANPDAASEQAEVIILGSGGLATSSTRVRRWTSRGVEQHHLLDPRTGRPATGPWRTVTAAGPTCVAANVASTAAVVLGDEAEDWLRARGVDARLVDSTGQITRVGAWPAPEEER